MARATEGSDRRDERGASRSERSERLDAASEYAPEGSASDGGAAGGKPTAKRRRF